jgi:hypothetical protein
MDSHQHLDGGRRQIVRIAPIALAILTNAGFAGSLTTDSYGIIHDSTTGLEWFVGPDEDTNWFEATEWVEDLDLDGGGWRFPTAQEARSLFDAGIGGSSAPVAIGITNWWVWVSGTCHNNDMARCFSFYDGLANYDSKDFYNTERALAVR